MSPDPSRRTFVRAGTAALVVGSAGCVTSLTDAASTGVRADRTTETLEYREGFDDEATTLRSRYGSAGVWGLDDGPSLGPGVEYVGAWHGSTAVPERGSGDGNGNGNGNEDSPFATLDVAALVYRLGGGTDGNQPNGNEYRVWLWAGGRPRQREGRLGRANVTRIAVRAAAASGWSLRTYAPRAPTRDGPVPVALDGRGPSGRTPLPGGGIAPDDVRTGPDGRVAVAWQGVSGGPRSVNAVCAFTPVDRSPFGVSLSAGIAAARGVL